MAPTRGCISRLTANVLCIGNHTLSGLGDFLEETVGDPGGDVAGGQAVGNVVPLACGSGSDRPQVSCQRFAVGIARDELDSRPPRL